MNFIPIFCARVLCVSVLLLLFAPSSVSAQSGPYIVQDLGTLGGQYSIASAINNSGQVVGLAETAAASAHGFLYSNGKMIDLGTLGGSGSFAYAINAAGQVVGQADVANGFGTYHAFLYSGGKMMDLKTLGGSDSVASAINDAGQIVGYAATTGNAAYLAFLYSGGKMQSLGTLGGTSGGAAGINSAGLIVGGASLAGNMSTHAFVLKNGQLSDLGTLGGDTSMAYAINASGQIVGQASTATRLPHAFFYSGGKMTDLGTFGGTFSRATAINGAGQVVGGAHTAKEAANHAFLYSGGKMTDLNTTLPPGSGWVLNEAAGINDKGQIVGSGQHNGQGRAFLLVPIVLTGFTLNPVSIPSGLNTTASVTLSVKAPVGGTKVTIANGAATVVTVTVAAGASGGSAPLKGGAPGVYKLTAKLGSVALPATLTVTAPVLTGFSLSPASVPTGGKSTATVVLSGPAGAGGVKVPLYYTTSTLATVSIAPGSTMGTATLTAGRPGAFTLSARLGSVTKSVVWTVTPAPVTVPVKNDASAPMGFAFGAATVKAGTPVTWLNQSTGPHSIVWDSRVPTSSPLPGSNIGGFRAGARSATWTAPQVAASTTYHYHCGIHGVSMAGTVVVTP